MPLSDGACGEAVVDGKPPAWFVYLLKCRDGTLYCGITNNVPRRLREHERGQVKYTRGRLPICLAYCELARDRSAALRREARCKALPRADKLRLVSSGEVMVAARSPRRERRAKSRS